INEEQTSLLYFKKFSLNNLSISFIIVTSILMFISVIIGRKEINHNVKSFYILMLLSQSLLSMIFSTADLLIFYIVFELVLLIVFLQLGIFTKGFVCSSKFLIVLSAGALSILFSVIYIFGITGTTDINALIRTEFTRPQELIIFTAMFIGFACKTALFPMHIWLPDAHTQSPTTMSIILSGILLKIGAFGMIRILLPIAQNGCKECQHIVFIVAVITLIYAIIATLSQRNLKRIIAYISIIHMSIITIGIFSLDMNGIAGAFYNMLAHSFIIPMLFVIAHIIEFNFSTRDIDKISGIISSSPTLSAFAIIPILSVISIPLFPCFTGEFLILLGIINSHFVLAISLCVLIMCSMFYFFRIYQKIFFGEKIKNNFAISTENIGCLTILSCGILTLCLVPNSILSAIINTLKIMVIEQ
ncbi:MAG: NADH-quinone oxidoreductase subunit M, partial [Alphaproteobacteria bacterium]|nr:NADH-quinone oxidoreductase subunit M [Alphaproteobacteria bacterium]